MLSKRIETHVGDGNPISLLSTVITDELVESR